jgi:antitoxin MazE
MKIQLEKWGNSIRFLIPHKIAVSFGIDETSTVELTEANGVLIITKKPKVPTLNELLASIPKDFQYPDDVSDFVDSLPLGQELL